MTEATYTAWDGQRYEWPPPQGWYEAWDGQWWPEGYGPQPQAEAGTDDGDRTRGESTDDIVAGASVEESAAPESMMAENAVAESTVYDHAAAERTVYDHAVAESTVHDHAAAESTVDEDAVTESMLAENAVAESTVHDHAAADSAAADSTGSEMPVDQDALTASFGSAGSDLPTETSEAGESSTGVASSVATSYSAEPTNGSAAAFPETSWDPPGFGSSTDSDSSFTRSGDAGQEESSASAQAVTTGDHTPMTTWAAETGDSSATEMAEPGIESNWAADIESDKPTDYSTEGWSEEIVQGLRDQDSHSDHAPFEAADFTVAEADADAYAGTADFADTSGGLPDPEATTTEPGTELFARLQAEALQEEIPQQGAAGSDMVNDVAADAVIGLDSAEESTRDMLELDGEPTSEQPVVDTTQPEFITGFDGAEPGVANDDPGLSETQAVPAPTYDDHGPLEAQAVDDAAYDDQGLVEAQAVDDAAYDDHGPLEAQAVDDAAYDDHGPLEAQAVDDAAYDDQGLVGAQAVDDAAYDDHGSLEAQAVDTQSFDAPSFVPNQAAPPAPDAQAYTDPGFGGEYQGGDYQGMPGQTVAQEAPVAGFEPPRSAVSPLDAPAPAAGPGQRVISILIGVLALIAAGTIGYLAFQLQDDSDDGGGADQGASETGGAAAIGSLANPHDPGSGIRIEYPDGAETQSWTLQLQSVDSDGADGEARLAVQIANDEAQGQGQLSDLQLALVDADGNDLASTPSQCGAGDSLDLAATVDAGQAVSGPVCWSLASALPDTALLAVESTKAQGRVYIALP